MATFFPKEFAWLILSLLLLAVWSAIYVVLRNPFNRREMLIASMWTSLLGFTEPIFVPEYWNPYSLFDLARRTGFDIESFIFSFAVGGIAVSIYEMWLKGPHLAMSDEEKMQSRHKMHFWALAAAPLVFVLLLLFSALNPIYSAVIALIVGFCATLWCRPDLFFKMSMSGIIFFLIYFFTFALFDALFPGYVQEVWNLGDLSGWFLFTVPAEELMFAFTFGLFWSSIYEHVTWQKMRNLSKINTIN